MVKFLLIYPSSAFNKRKKHSSSKIISLNLGSEQVRKKIAQNFKQNVGILNCEEASCQLSKNNFCSFLEKNLERNFFKNVWKYRVLLGFWAKKRTSAALMVFSNLISKCTVKLGWFRWVWCIFFKSFGTQRYKSSWQWFSLFQC